MMGPYNVTSRPVISRYCIVAARWSNVDGAAVLALWSIEEGQAMQPSPEIAVVGETIQHSDTAAITGQ